MIQSVEKKISYPEIIQDLYGLKMDLLKAGFDVLNVATDSNGTHVYLDPREEKNPIPIVASWVGRPSPSLNLRAYEKRLKEASELAKVHEQKRAKYEQTVSKIKFFIVRPLKRHLF